MPTIVLTIPGNKYDTFKRYFLLTHPNQTTNGPNPISDDDWIRLRVLLFAQGAYIKALTAEHTQSNLPPIDNNIIS